MLLRRIDFNTGRRYTADGQPITLLLDSHGVTYFYDRARSIMGKLDKVLPPRADDQYIMGTFLERYFCNEYVCLATFEWENLEEEHSRQPADLFKQEPFDPDDASTPSDADIPALAIDLRVAGAEIAVLRDLLFFERDWHHLSPKADAHAHQALAYLELAAQAFTLADLEQARALADIQLGGPRR